MATTRKSTRNTARATLAVGMAASLGANAYSSAHTVLGVIVAAFPPVALFVTMELMLRIPAKQSRVRRCVVRVALVSVVLVAAWVSYWHIVDLVMDAGQHGITPYLYPAIVDAPMVIASLMLNDVPATPARRKPANVTPIKRTRKTA